MTEEKTYTLDELKKSLNEQQQRFGEARLFNNKVQAYMIAYPDCEYKSASASATRLLEDVRIKQFIELLKNDIEDMTGVSKIRNVAELAKIAYSNISHIHDSWIDLSDWEEIKENNPDILHAIESIDTKTEQKTYKTDGDDESEIEIKYVKVKFYNKTSAIQEINKMMGYNEAEKHEIKTTYEKLTPERAKEIDEALENDC
ncbi:MAG: terminase small subunit [Candidatus Hodarchaeales archaeon]|jgi:hypothetical protein